MKRIIRTTLLAVAGLLILQSSGLAAPGGYYIGADSKQALEQARKANPNNYAVNYFLGQIYLAEGNRDGAIDAWSAFLAAAPTDGRSVAVRERMTLLKQAQAREFAKKVVAAGGAAPATLPANTIAVTDFKNLGTAKLVPFIKGLTAMIISDLAKVPQVRVLERAKIQALMQEMQLGLAAGIIDADSAPKLGKMVQARKVAWGKMDTPDGSNLKITSIVTEIMENATLQQTDAEGAMDQFFKLQKQLVFGILAGMGVDVNQLPEKVQKAVKRVHTTSVRALIQFGMGVDFLDNKDFAQAKQAFGKAAKIDPEFDLAGEAEVATPISDVPVTSDGATEEVAMSTAGSGEEKKEEQDAAGDSAASDETAISSDQSTAETTTTDTNTTNDTTTDTSQTVTTNETENSDLPTNRDGYLVNALSYFPSPSYTRNYDGMVFNTAPVDFSQSFQIDEWYNGGFGVGLMDGLEDVITALDPRNGNAVTSGVPNDAEWGALGSNEYFIWGAWADVDHMVDGADIYAFASYGYFVMGDVTSETVVDGLVGSVLYSGKAYGTHSSIPDEMMNGTFSANVDFSGATVSDFDWQVSGTHSASVENGSGPIMHGNYYITSGTWKIDNTTVGVPANRTVAGSFYGNQAQATAGIVVVEDASVQIHGLFVSE
jgi:tetratricopeptide (TPR) repeat protein